MLTDARNILKPHIYFARLCRFLWGRDFNQEAKSVVNGSLLFILFLFATFETQLLGVKLVLKPRPYIHDCVYYSAIPF